MFDVGDLVSCKITITMHDPGCETIGIITEHVRPILSTQSFFTIHVLNPSMYEGANLSRFDIELTLLVKRFRMVCHGV
jgi:hypothetical protein